MKHGDFSELADNYSNFRPAYAENVVDAVFGMLSKRPGCTDVADVGAGTGIWTRMLASRSPASVTAVEPNENMRTLGIRDSKELEIRWLNGFAEKTGLDSNSVDLLSMASSFHWADFDRAIEEFDRVLRRTGMFVAVWNPRIIPKGSIYEEIENKITELNPKIVRKSSGNSTFTDQLFERLEKSAAFKDITYIESCHEEERTLDAYLGAWRSVNDIQAQLGTEKFQAFLTYVEERLRDVGRICVRYKTRAWLARKP